MVEKIPVRPESVRGLGNIISPAKKLEDFSVFNSSLSYVDGFYTMEYSTTSVRVELTASASSITVGESLTLTATVSDGGTAVEGASVSFTSGNLAIGTGVTGSDGVATLTVSTLEAGSYSITATYDEVVSSAVTVTVSYGFTSVTVSSDKSILSYVDSESATLTAQLKNGDASASVSGETVDFYKYVDGTNDVLLGSGVTDSNGEATYSYSSQGVGDIQVYAKVRTLVSKTYAIEDCTDTILGDVDQSSKFGLSIGLRNTGTSSISYDSTNKQYIVNVTKDNSESFIPINSADGLDDIVIEFDTQLPSYPVINALCFYKETNNWGRLGTVKTSSTSTKYEYGGNTNGTYAEADITGSTPPSNTWLHHKFTITNDTIHRQVYNSETLIYEDTRTYTGFFTSTTKYGFTALWSTGWKGYYKNIKIKPL